MYISSQPPSIDDLDPQAPQNMLNARIQHQHLDINIGYKGGSHM